MLRTQVEEKFSSYVEKWMCQLEEYLPLLLSVGDNNNNNDEDDGDRTARIAALVNKLTALHKEYYTTKWASAHEDVLAFFNPVWLTPLESALLWNTDWKPSIIFRLLESSLMFRNSATSTRGCGGGSGAGAADGNNDVLRLFPAAENDYMMMSEPQKRKIESLKSRIRVEEEKVEREMERQQVAMADRRMVELSRLVSRLNTSMTGEQQPSSAAAAAKVDGLVEAALNDLIAGLERVMKMADCVRLKTLKGVLDVLNPLQSVDLLAAFSMLQIRTRKWGKKKLQQPYM